MRAPLQYAVKQLIISRFDAVAANATDSSTATTPEESHEVDDTPSPATTAAPPVLGLKRPQSPEPSVDADAKFAARLQALEDLQSRSRSTRHGGTAATRAVARDSAAAARKTKKAAARKKKSAVTVGVGEDDGSANEEGMPKKKRAGGGGSGAGSGGGFNKPYRLSDELSFVCGGEEQVSIDMYMCEVVCVLAKTI